MASRNHRCLDPAQSSQATPLKCLAKVRNLENKWRMTGLHGLTNHGDLTKLKKFRTMERPEAPVQSGAIPLLRSPFEA
jgi:hypothetical protein